MVNEPRHDCDAAAAERALSGWLASFDEARAELVRAERRARALGQAIDCWSDRARTLAEAGGRVAVPEGSFGYVAYNIPDFLNLLFDLDAMLAADPDHRSADLRYRPVAFLEIGCGVARNLFLVRETGVLNWHRAEGFDILEGYVEASRSVFDLGDAVRVGDAMNWDYRGYDVVFSYQPFSDEALERAYEERLIEQLPVGGYIVSPLGELFATHPRLLARGDSGAIWKKIV